MWILLKEVKIMYEIHSLNKGNISELKRLNCFRKNFNRLNQDFFQVYYSSNQFQQLLLKKKVKLLSRDDSFIGYIWTDNKAYSTYIINSMYVSEDANMLKAYKWLISSIKPPSLIIYSCIKNEYNYGFLKRLKFTKTRGLLGMSIKLNSLFHIKDKENIDFYKVIKGKDEGIRCYVQNEIFHHKDRIPLKVEDIYYDELQDYYCDDGSILIKKGQKYVGYGQIIMGKGIPIIVNFGILKNYRNKGYGKLLLMYMLNIIYKKGNKIAKINVDSSNKAAIKLYKKVGFKEDFEESQWHLK